MIDRDQEHLRLLTLCYYILAGATALFSLFALLYVGFGAIMLSGIVPQNQTQNGDPRVVGYVLTAIGTAIGVCTILVLNRPDVKNLFLPAHIVPEGAL